MAPNNAPEKNYVLEEVPANSEKQEHGGASSVETLVGLRTDLAKFYRLNQKLRAINGAEKGNDAKRTVDQLNGILRSKGIGGENGGIDSKAYFATNGKDVVLVANTMVDGKPVSSRDAIFEAFAKIDALIADPFSQELSLIEGKIREINQDYQKSTNDIDRIADGLVNLIGGQGNDRKHQAKIDTIRVGASPVWGRFCKMYYERHEQLRPKIEAKTLSQAEATELRVLQSQKNRFEAIFDAKLERPKWVTVDVAEFLWETKGDMGRNAVEFVKGFGEGAFMAVFGTFILMYKLSTEPEVRAALSESAGRAFEFCKNNATNPQKFIDLFKETLEKEMDRVSALPPAEQANYIGQLAGTVVATLAGAKASKDLLSSNALRIRKVAAPVDDLAAKAVIKEITHVRTWDDLQSYVKTIDRVRMRDGMNGEELNRMVAAIRTGKDASLINKLPNAGGIRAKARELIKEGGYVPEKGRIARIAEANWVDAWVNGMKGAAEKMDELTLGARTKIWKSVREASEKYLPKEAGEFIRDRFFPKEIIGKAEWLQGKLSKINKVHDFIDERIITALRMSLSRFVESAKEWSAGAARAAWAEVNHHYEMLKLSFPASSGPSGTAKFFAGFESAFPDVSRAVKSASDAVERSGWAIVHTAAETKKRVADALSGISRAKEDVVIAKNDLTDLVTRFDPKLGLARNMRKGLVFEGGFALHETTDAAGAKMLRFVGKDGKFLTDKSGKVLQFSEASNFGKKGAVVRGENGAYGFIDRDGEWILDPKNQFQSIRHLSETKKVVQLPDGKFRTVDLVDPKDNAGMKFQYWHDGGGYDFMTDPQEGRAIGVVRSVDDNGKEQFARFVIKAESEEIKPLHYLHVDHFSDEWYAAALNKIHKDGKKEWVMIDKDGLQLPDSMKIYADDPASALNAFRERRFNREFFDAPVYHRHKDIIMSHLSKAKVPWHAEMEVVRTTVDSVYLLQREVDGKVLKGFFNVRTKTFVAPEFNAVFTDDAAHGFLRVKTADGNWGILNSEKGGYHIHPDSARKYASFQLVDPRTGMFEVEVKTVRNGTIQSRYGLMGLDGKEYIKPEFDHIQSPRDGLYRGVNYDGENYSKVTRISREFDISRMRATGAGERQGHAFGAGAGIEVASDPLSSAIATGMAISDTSKVIRKGENVYQMNGSLALQELKKFGKKGLLSAEESLFGKGAKSFDDFLNEKTMGMKVWVERHMQIFDEYVKKRLTDFIREYAKDGSRSISKAEYSAIIRNYVEPIRHEMENELRAKLNPFFGLKFDSPSFGGFSIFQDAANSPSWISTVNSR